MGRPEPYILLAQSFVHPHLDEYVDEVIFAEPVVITGCEFLEQNASPSTSNVSIIGATSPPSFALEVFVHCEGESRFRRLCPPFLYSHLSSSILEIEAVATNHLVLRGSYHNLTLVVYGNTAEDLGQFNIELDFDSSVANAVPSPSDDNFEDLPSVLHMAKLTFEESISPVKSLCFPVPDLDIAPEMKKFLHLVLKIRQISNDGIAVYKIIDSVVSAVCSDINSKSDVQDRLKKARFAMEEGKEGTRQINSLLSETRIELLEFYRNNHSGSMDYQSLEDDLFIESDDIVSSKYLIEMLDQCFPDFRKISADSLSLRAENESMILWLGAILVLCSSRDSCFHFVNSGGMKQVISLLSPEIKKPTALLLLLLGVVERATQHVIGCEGFLEWWPREDENIPVQNSDGYCHLLKLLLENDREDVAFLVTYLLHRLRLYEVASRYESALLSILTIWSDDSQITKGGIESLLYASSLLKQVLKLLEFSGSIDNPSPLAIARKSYLLYQSENLLSYETTASIIESCKYIFGKWDIDTNLLFLLKERGFFPLSAALLSSPLLRSTKGVAADVFMEIVTSIEYFLLKLLFSRSGLCFLLIQPEMASLLVHSLEDAEGTSKSECMSLRQATVLLLKGFVCHPREISMITQLHLTVGSAIDRMLAVDPQSHDFLWVIWELCAISRSNAGRQALLSLCYFPEALSVMLEAMRSFKNLEPPENGSSSLCLAIFHCASEIFEVLVTDSTASSLKSWIEHAVELHKTLHLSSPGSNRKDAPTRLLEWIDAGVIYHQNGAVGLLRYGAVLASGGDAHVASTSILISDSVDVENVLGAPSNGSDGQVVDNLLGKLVTDKYFEGIVLRDASITQLTTTFRILAFMSENSSVAASLFEEGALTLIYVVLVNCRLMLERSSNTYDYLLDEGAECNPTSDLLSGRAHEQSLVDLMVPSLILLINLLHKLQETKEQYRNKKLLNALLQLHREVSPRLAGCASDLSYPYPNSALGFGAVCHLIASSLACWPIFNWSPGLFHSLLESVQATSLLSLGPKDACSMFSLLGDLFPEEGIWLWENEMPSVTALRALSVAVIVGPEAEKDTNWYQSPEYVSVLVLRLTPQLDRIAQIVLHLAFTALVVIQDMLRVFIIRMACQKTECAVVLLRPVVSWMKMTLNQIFLSETDIFKVHRLLLFLANLLEHPRGKVLLFEVGALQTLEKVLERCTDSCSDVKQLVDSNNVGLLSWSVPAFRCLTSIISYRISICQSKVPSYAIISIEESHLFARILKLCQVLPAGRELLACLVTLKELTSLIHVCSATSSIFLQIQSSLEENEPYQQDTNGSPSDYWERIPPFFNCLKKLLGCLESNDSASVFVVESVHALCVCAICLSKDGESCEGLSLLKSLFGLPSCLDNSPVFDDEGLKCVVELLQRIEKKIGDDSYLASSKGNLILNLVKDSVEGLLLLLHGTVGTSHAIRNSILWKSTSSHSSIVHSAIITSKLMPSLNEISLDNMSALSFTNVWGLNEKSKKGGDDFVSSMAEKFVWDCPDTLPERQLSQGLPTKRKLVSAEGSGKRIRETTGSEVLGSNTLARGLSITSISSGPTRRDTFRQRKPNTSRPPSMHVDDYVARERNIDGANNGSNILNSQRGAPSGGRPPSIHVDEFMARQKERHKPMASTNVNASESRNSTFENTIGHEKLDRLGQLKVDPDDELQGIDIVFDEESDFDDRLPFPHPDDNILPAPVTIRENSPGSIVEETGADTAESTRLLHMSIPLASEDRGSNSDLSLRKTVSRDVTIVHEKSVPSEKNFIGTVNAKATFYEQSAESNYASPVSLMKGIDTVHPSNVTGFPSKLTSTATTSTGQPSLLLPTNYQRGSPRKSTNSSGVARSQGRSEEKVLINQPPLPPMPPPTHLSAHGIDQIPSHPSSYINTLRDAPPSISGHSRQHFDANGVNITGFHFPSDNLAGSNLLPSLSTSQSILDSNISWNMIPSGTFSSTVSARPMPPLPPTPPPLSAIAQTTQNSSYNQTANLGVQPPLPSTLINSDARLGIISNSGTSVASFSLTPFTLSNRQSSRPGSNFSSPPQHQSQSSSSTTIPLPNSLLSLQSIQTRPPPPPPPPHGIRPPNLPSGPLISQLEQAIVPQQSTLQVQVQPLQVTQQLNGSQIQFFYQTQQEPALQPLQPVLGQAQQQGIALQSDSAAQQQLESGITLQQYFSSPEAIQALVRDRDKLCQLLEKHPKLMQMLQERLGQH